MSEKNQEIWKGIESNWINPDINWQEAQYITVGIDVGSVSSQACILADNQIYAYGNIRTYLNSSDRAAKALNYALEDTDITEDRLDYVIGTGYGRVHMPMADRTLTEIACQARGANFIYGPTVRTVLDVGGQDIKAIRCDQKGKVENFLMNDKCAAGTGRGMEVFADLVGVSISDIGQMSLQVDQEPEPVSELCVIYAKTEATRLLRNGWSIEKVLAAYCRAMTERIFSLTERIGIEADFAVSGGMAKNPGIINRLMPMIGLERLTTNWDTQIIGACGAALFGQALCQKGKARKK